MKRAALEEAAAAVEAHIWEGVECRIWEAAVECRAQGAVVECSARVAVDSAAAVHIWEVESAVVLAGEDLEEGPISAESGGADRWPGLNPQRGGKLICGPAALAAECE